MDYLSIHHEDSYVIYHVVYSRTGVLKEGSIYSCLALRTWGKGADIAWLASLRTVRFARSLLPLKGQSALSQSHVIERVSLRRKYVRTLATFSFSFFLLFL